MSEDIQKKIREELEALQSSKVATRTDKQLQNYDAWINDKPLQERRKKASIEATKGVSRPSIKQKLKEFYSDPSNHKNISEKNRLQAQLDHWKKAHQEGVNRRQQNPEHAKMVAERNKNTAKTKEWKEAQRSGSIRKYKEDSEYNKKRSYSLRKAKGKECKTPYGVFDSAAAFNEKGFTSCNFADNMRMKPHLFYYTENGPGNPTYEDVVYTPYGEFPKGNTGSKQNSGGKDRAFEAAKQAGNEFALKYKDKYAWWNKVSKLFPDQYYIKNEIKREWIIKY